MRSSLTRRALKSAGIGAFFRPRDLEALEIDFPQLQRLVAAGSVEKVSRGLYRLAAVAPDEFETIAMVASAVPGGIVCLLSALRVHGIGTQAPHEVWLALDRKARRPARFATQVRVVRFSGPMLTYGIVTRSLLGVTVRMTSPARTVVDCFRYRNKIGVDVALEALRDGVRSRVTNIDAIMRAAEACRASSVVRVYLEALGP